MKDILITLLCAFAVMGIVTFFAIKYEKKIFNNGKCRVCGNSLELFDYDSQGGRGYKCPRCYRHVWISYNCVDRNYKEKENDV